MGFPRLDVAHIFFPHAQLLMTGRIRVPLALLPAPFLANLASLSWRGAFLDVPIRRWWAVQPINPGLHGLDLSTHCPDIRSH